MGRKQSFKPSIAESADKNQDKTGHYCTTEQEQQDQNAGETPEVKVTGTVPIKDMFRYASCLDMVMLAGSLICAVLNGITIILRVVVFGGIADMFIYDSRGYGSWLEENWTNITAIFPNATMEQMLENAEYWIPLLDHNNMTSVDVTGQVPEGDIMDRIAVYCTQFAVLGTIEFVLGYLQCYLSKVSASHQATVMKMELFSSILSKDMSWFDVNRSGELSNRLTEDTDRVEDGIGEKFALTFQQISSFITGIFVGFYYGWELALIMCCSLPFMATILGLLGKYTTRLSAMELNAYAQAGAAAEEALSAIRTVTAFGGQQVEIEKYSSELGPAKECGKKKGRVVGTAMGSAQFIFFTFNAVVFFGASKFVYDGRLSAGDVLAVFFALMNGAMYINQVPATYQNFTDTRGVVYEIFRLIDQDPGIDSSSDDGLKPTKVEGNLKLSNVTFYYPSRKECQVLRGVNVEAEAGQTVALVGHSGCGKSTVVQLLQRFYDPAAGTVSIDGYDVKDLNIKWLRQQMGVVNQEPVLFPHSVAENIALGGEDVTRQQVIMAAKEANAHDFITKLPQGYDTEVGERGAQLSGGQKQRVAIARALVSNPKILLLDEATSALDAESESVVQSALNKVRQGRTTIVIAHRLSTIKNADIIIGIADGATEEKGTHDELMAHKGIYYQLVTRQSQNFDVEDMGVLNDNREELLLHDSRRITISSQLPMASDELESNVPTEKALTEEDDLQAPSAVEVMKLNAPEWPYLSVGCVFAIIEGCTMPSFALLVGEVIRILTIIDEDTYKTDSVIYCCLFTVLGAVAALSMFIRNVTFAIAAENMTLRLRTRVFTSLMQQDMTFYDHPQHQTGTLTALLATDASAVHAASGTRLSVVFMGLASIGCGFIIAFIYSWQITLLMIAFIPFLILASSTRGNVHLKNMNRKAKDARVSKDRQIATAVIDNIRTVASLAKEAEFQTKFEEVVQETHSRLTRTAHIDGVSYGFTHAVLLYCFAAAFYAGGYLIKEDQLSYPDVQTTLLVVVFGTTAAGQAMIYAADYGKAKVAAAKIFTLFRRNPAIDSLADTGTKLDNYSPTSDFKDVHFNYPTRPKTTVLNGIDLLVKPGQTVALVGASGCGKSTVIQLLERFYDPLQGRVKLDKCQLPDLQVRWLRRQLSLVSQEPVLFNRSIRENIAYGDNSRQVTMDEIVQAAKDANIHNFISSIPQGYDTVVGDKGTQLSGGQKQRVAIARALVSNPCLLLLDEATSALDTESEKIVQEALDRAQEGRTCIVIAHRLSTIQNADCIAVVHNGQIAEIGTHTQLMDTRGLYYNLNMAQLHAIDA